MVFVVHRNSQTWIRNENRGLEYVKLHFKSDASSVDNLLTAKLRTMECSDYIVINNNCIEKQTAQIYGLIQLNQLSNINKDVQLSTRLSANYQLLRHTVFTVLIVCQIVTQSSETIGDVDQVKSNLMMMYRLI